MSKDYLDHTPLKSKGEESRKNADSHDDKDREITVREDIAEGIGVDAQATAPSTLKEKGSADARESLNAEGSRKPAPSDKKQDDDCGGTATKTHFYVALGALIAGLAMFILSFVVGQSGTTLLFASMLVELCGVSFCNAQKRRGDFTACKVVRYACYAVMIAAIVVVLIGISVITGGQNA